ncbi:MAG: PHP domain-containing protein [Deltaproteobacteria bacterium]|nr:PHP domain-containing protein [Deltaproteobacteria bacterium]
MKFCKTITISAILTALFIYSAPTFAGEYTQLRGVVHVHSKYSSGRYSIEELVAKAEAKNIEVLVLTDHDQVVMEYGLFPLRNLIKKKEERNSVLLAGVDNYLAEIKRINTRQQSVLIIPGVQSSPFYYWRGNPFKRGLTAHNFRKELLLIGLSSPDDYHGLPLLHGGLSTRYVTDLMARFIIFLTGFLLAVYLLYQKGSMRIGALVIALMSIALMINHHPFKSSRYDPYHGDQGTAPYQEVIDYVASRGGLVFWAHPESNYSKNGVQLGPIRMVTEHYSDDLIESTNYTGFAAIYGDTSIITNAGRQWDRILMDYCRGRRAGPVWAIAGSDFHEEQKGFALDNFQTVFLCKNKRRADVLQALERGRVYALRQAKGMRLVLDQFRIKDKTTGRTAIMGQELSINGSPIIEGRITASDLGHHPVTVSIVKAGQQNWTFEGQTPLDFHFVDKDHWNGKIFYRLDVHGKTAGRLLSNPIFVMRK